MRIAKQLDKLMQDGELSPADIRRWFGRSHSTVWTWINKNVTVRGTRSQIKKVEERLHLLSLAITQGRFPTPVDLNQRGRTKYIEALRNELENGRLSKSGAS